MNYEESIKYWLSGELVQGKIMFFSALLLGIACYFLFDAKASVFVSGIIIPLFLLAVISGGYGANLLLRRRKQVATALTLFKSNPHQVIAQEVERANAEIRTYNLLKIIWMVVTFVGITLFFFTNGYTKGLAAGLIIFGFSAYVIDTLLKRRVLIYKSRIRHFKNKTTKKLCKTALIAGATGLVGHHLLNLLLADENYSKVRVLTRRSLSYNHEKIDEIVSDYETLEAHRSQLAADVIFCCLGTTLKKAGSKEAFRKIDHDYPVKLGEFTKHNGADTYILISALGASTSSSMFYSRVKGETERDILGIGFKNVHIIRPSLILGERKEERLIEGMAARAAPFVNAFLIGGLRKYQFIAAEQIAIAMQSISLSSDTGIQIYESDKLRDY